MVPLGSKIASPSSKIAFLRLRMRSRSRQRSLILEKRSLSGKWPLLVGTLSLGGQMISHIGRMISHRKRGSLSGKKISLSGEIDSQSQNDVSVGK